MTPLRGWNEDWVERWRGPLTGWFVKRGARLADADDHVAEVFARAWTKREGFAGEGDAAVGAWLRGFARNVEREARRRPRPASFEELGSRESDIADAEPNDADDTRRVHAALDRLPPIERALIGAFYFEGTSAARVAQLFGISERAIEGRLRRARERLRGWLIAPEPARRT